MTRTRRLLLWALVLSPVALLPTAFAFSRLWLNHHLQRELAFGDFRLRLKNPLLGWDLNFSADAVDVSAPRFALATGRVSADARIWNSVASLKPSLSVSTDTVRIAVEPDSLADSASVARKRKRKPVFPNLRLPADFRFAAARVEITSGGKPIAIISTPVFYSQGPKGVGFEMAGISAVVGARGDSARSGSSRLEWNAYTHISARWFGKWVRYQMRMQDTLGRFVKLDGERRKSDLRVGSDTVDMSLPDLSLLAPLFRRAPPDLQGLTLKASLTTGEHRLVHVHAGLSTPPVWVIARQAAEIDVEAEDDDGRLTLNATGPSGELAYLQGRFRLPPADTGGIKAMLPGLAAELSGYTRNLRFRIGRRLLPGDAEIRKLTLSPGLLLSAQVRTRDSSVLDGRAFRVQDSAHAGGDSSWKVVFGGRADPKETWARAWTDTNVAFKSGRIEAMADRAGLHVETWIQQPRAYGAAADSLYAEQTVNKAGYYLTASRVYGKEAMWPITGQVEWGRRVGGKVVHKSQVSLAFRTQHPRYGWAEYSMPDPRSMSVRVENLEAQKLPYVKLPRLTALAPVVTGIFAWDIEERNGDIDAGATLSYAGQSLEVEANAHWDAALFIAQGLDVTISGSKLHFSGSARLGGRQFWQMGKLELKDVRSLAMEAHRFDASRLAPFLGAGYPVARAALDGRLGYTDSTGFNGQYRIENLDLTPIRKLVAIPRLVLTGQGENLRLEMRTTSTAYPWLNDSLQVEVQGVLGKVPGILVDATSDDGLKVSFHGSSGEFRDIDGIFSVSGNAALPGQAGLIRDVRLGGHYATPFSRDLLKEMVLDSGSFAGRYAIPGLDTQAFSGTMSLRDGRLRIPDLRSENGQGLTLSGEADCEVAGAPKVTARLRGENLALRWPGIQKLVLRDADASLRVDSAGLSAEARVGRAEFASSRPPISMHGRLDDVTFQYVQPPAPKAGKAAGPVPTLRVKAKLSDFLFKHKIGFRELQKSIGKVKVDKRKKRVKPVDVQLNLETAGAGNRIETDVLRMAFTGDLAVKGVYPYTLLSGEFSALKGELGQTTQSYDITDFDLKWQNATVEEGRISVEGAKKLRVDCKPETERTCNVYVKLAGRLDEMSFTYDSDCGNNTGESLEPSALINSVNRGCWSDVDVAGAGGGNYGEAVFALLEPTINEKLSSVGDRLSGGWIKRTSVTGIGSAVAKDTAGNEAIAIGVESKEKWGMSVKANAGYHSERNVANPWESKVAVEWRPPLEKASKSSDWKRAVRDRVTLEASAETRPDEPGNVATHQEARKQVGIRYRYKFWNLW